LPINYFLVGPPLSMNPNWAHPRPSTNQEVVMPCWRRPRSRPAFTLLELLVVLAIIAVLLALLLPAVQKARLAGWRTACASNLHNHGLAIFQFEGAHGRLPPGWVQGPFAAGGVPGEAEHGMWPFLLPHLEQEALARSYRRDVSCYDPANQPAAATPLRILQCPAAEPNRAETTAEQPAWPPGGQGACTDYAPISLNPILADRGLIDPAENFEGALPLNGTVRLADVTDGTSGTLLLVESAGRPRRWELGRLVPDAVTLGGPWSSAANALAVRGFAGAGGPDTAPCALNCTNDGEVYGFHTGGANVLFADGSARFLNEGLALRTLAHLVTRAGGEVIAAGDF
jgi:prepilin-type N-terminal cleavage/methylation domain-containing protein/prepilin-type processing-associated H-X9-DG protein